MEHFSSILVFLLRNIVFEPEAVDLNAEEVRQAMEKRRRLMSNASSLSASLSAVSPTPSDISSDG